MIFMTMIMLLLLMKLQNMLIKNVIKNKSVTMRHHFVTAMHDTFNYNPKLQCDKRMVATICNRSIID